MFRCTLDAGTCGLFRLLIENLFDPLMLLLSACAAVVFIWGLVEYLRELSGGHVSSSGHDGRQHMLWGIVGLFVIFAVYQIIVIIQNTVNGLFGN